MDLPHGERGQGLRSLGIADHLQRSRILSRPGSDQRGEHRHTDGTGGQPMAGPRNQSGLHRLLHLQRKHQHVLCHQVTAATLPDHRLVYPLFGWPKFNLLLSGWWLNSQQPEEQSLPTRSERSNWFATSPTGTTSSSAVRWFSVCSSSTMLWRRFLSYKYTSSPTSGASGTY